MRTPEAGSNNIPGLTTFRYGISNNCRISAIVESEWKNRVEKPKQRPVAVESR
jgi:hypothetical protein